MNLKEKLKRWGVTYTVDMGVVTLEAQPDDLDSLCDGEGVVVNKEFSDFLDELAEYRAYLDAHPEGSDRGGYVVYVDNGTESCFFMENAGVWF